MNDRVPVHVLTGFLGVGKTTAVRDLLTRRADRERIAVIVNEFGDIGIDGALLSDCASCVLKEVPGGCICCTAMPDLEASIVEMMDIVCPTRLIVEPTGLARASEIVDLFRSTRFEPRFEVRPVVTILDPGRDNGAAYLEGGLFRDQVDVGDILVVNRCDLASEDEILRAEAFAKALVPSKMTVLRASHGVLPDFVLDKAIPGERELAVREKDAPMLEERHAQEGAVEGHVGHGLAHGAERIFDADRLADFIHALANGRLGLSGSVARAKGIFRSTAGWRAHEIAGGRFTSAETAYRRDNRFDVILKDPGPRDFESIDRALDASLVPEGARLLSVETEAGLLRAWDAAGFSRVGAPKTLGDLLKTANAPDLPWIWLVSEGGLIGAGAPREVLENGLVTLEDDAEPFRFHLPDDAGEIAEEWDTCRDVPALCGIRLTETPGGELPEMEET